MLLALLAFGIALLALIVVIVIVLRHWEDVRLLDPTSLKEEQERMQRHELIERRFERVSAEVSMPFKRVSRSAVHAMRGAYRKAHRNLRKLEQVYHKATKPLAAMAAPSTKDRIKILLGEARSLSRDLKWAEAERRLLDVLQLDAKQIDAYKLLGQIYLKQKLYPQAKETFDFLYKSKKADDAVLAALAEIAEAEGNLPQAEHMRLLAVEASPRQAFRHAELAELYLDRNLGGKAWQAAKKATELEPGSAKYLELSLEAAIAAHQKEEALLRLDKLRLLLDDHAKFQNWKEKIAGM